MKLQLLLCSAVFLCLLNYSCQTTKNNQHEEEQNTLLVEAHKNDHIFLATKDSLIAELASMETDTLDCTANVYWQIIGKGSEYIPKLIESLTDTTLTNIHHGCKNTKLNIGELSYFALVEIGDFPASAVTKMQFDVIGQKEGWPCWCFYDYLFDNKNKSAYQKKARSFYKNSNFEWIPYPDSTITDCMRKYSIEGRYKWNESTLQ